MDKELRKILIELIRAQAGDIDNSLPIEQLSLDEAIEKLKVIIEKYEPSAPNIIMIEPNFKVVADGNKGMERE
jgi:hypothetical protein